MKMSKCDNCNWIGQDAELKNVFPNIPNLMDRIEQGGIVPNGECPKCGALCYQHNSEPAQDTATPPVNELAWTCDKVKTVLESALTFPSEDMHPLVRQKITHCIKQLANQLTKAGQ